MSLSAKDIVMIMQRAAKLGVTSLTVGEVDISFNQNRGIPKETPISHIPAEPQAQAAPPEEEVKPTAEQRALDEWRGKELALLNGPVLDPYEWEKSQVSILENGAHEGEIEDAESI